MIYLIRNPETGGWIDTWFNSRETDDPEKAAAKFGSALAARQTVRHLLWKHRQSSDVPAPPLHYEVVAFRLEKVGVVLAE